MKRRFIPLLLATLSLVAEACGSPQRSAPMLSGNMPGPAESRLLFENNCHTCHPHGAAGLGPPLNNKPLPEFAIRAQVRKGLGAMPAFSQEMLSDDGLEKIAKYVQALRKAE